MKNMKKFITLCGFLILGSIACGDVDVVKAEAINEQTTDTSGYTITIPSDVDIDKDSGKGSFAVTGKVKAQSTIDVSIQSKNGYILKDKNGELPYNIDKKSFSIDNSRSASDIPLNEEFNIVSKTNTKVSGYYTDSLTFDITGKKYEYRLDIDGSLDENGRGDGSLTKFGRFDVYIDGKLIEKDADDFCRSIPYGSVWELKNIRSLDGYHYEESVKVPTKGVIGENVEDITGTYRITRINLKFYTNKLTINYHADGAQTWIHFDSVTYDVSGKDIAHTSVHLYGNSYDAKFGLGDVSRLKKDGYTAKPNTWIVGKNGNKEIRDDKGLSKVEDIADYCGVLDEFKKNDTTIDLYPIWTANTYTLTVNPNGGLINGDGSSKVLDTKLCFDTGNCCDINYLKPTRKGFEFLGWYDAPENGNIVYDSNGKCINNGNYWKDSSYVNPNNLTVYAQWKKVSYSAGTVLNIEGSDYIVMGQTEDGNYRLISGTSIGNIQYQPNQDSSGNYKLNISDEPDKKRYDGQNSNTYENSYIDRYLENTWYKNLPASMQKAIQETKIKQVSYTDSTTNPKWKFFDPEGGTNKYWYYNEGDEIAPNWVIYNKAKIPDNESGTYPYRYWSQKDAFDNEIYNSISRHVFLPCVEDIYNIVDLNNANKIRDFLNSTDNHLNYMWLRDAYSNSSQTAIYLDYNTRSMDNYYVTSKAMGIRPALVIDLSKVDYTVTGTVNYK